MEDKTGSAWSSTASTYAKKVGQTTVIAAEKLIELTESLRQINDESEVLDLGAGTGVVTRALTKIHPECKILATDISAKMLEELEKKSDDNVSTRQEDARELRRLGSARFSHVFSTFMIQFIVKPMDVLSGVHYCLKSHGVFGLGIWGRRLDTVAIWEKACQTIDPSFELKHQYADPHAWTTPDELESAFHEMGFIDINSEVLLMDFPFPSAEEYVDFWMDAKNPAIDKVVSLWKGDKEEMRQPMLKIAREQYGDGRDIKMEAALCVGRKA